MLTEDEIENLRNQNTHQTRRPKDYFVIDESDDLDAKDYAFIYGMTILAVGFVLGIAVEWHQQGNVPVAQEGCITAASDFQGKRP